MKSMTLKNYSEIFWQRSIPILILIARVSYSRVAIWKALHTMHSVKMETLKVILEN